MIPGSFSFVLDAKSVNKIRFKDPLTVITDPPRTGMDNEAVTALLRLQPETIIYISCNPHRFKTESKRFIKAGYEIKSVAIFDMFPQTNHIEVVFEMRLRVY